MRTIGRHWRGPRGDFRALCDYCGVAWRRSVLRKDAAGHLTCPDEGSGKDMVTLSRENAAMAGEPQFIVKDGGNDDNDAENYAANPMSILSAPFGWWQVMQAGTVGAVGFRWVPNLVSFYLPEVTAGAVVQPDSSLQPLRTDDVAVFEGSRLQSAADVLTEAGGHVTFWCKGSFDTSVAADTQMVMFMYYGAADGEAFYRGISLTWVNDVVRLGAVYGDSVTTVEEVVVTAPLSDSDDHLFMGKMESGRLVLQVDGVEYSTDTSATATGNRVDWTTVLLGSRNGNVPTRTLTGTLDEWALVDYTATATEITDMQTYFGNTYPELSL